MEVLALVGPSGTGKSHRAILVAVEVGADAIIDDGLLIQGSQVLAGVSAKRQATRLRAIKTALFTEPEHALEVREALARLAPERVLVLGTSIPMVERITGRLGLPAPSRYIDITEVATPEEIQRARHNRQRHGRHVVPAPTVEVKPRLSGTIMHPLRTWLRRRSGGEQALLVEQTVVRPSFTLLGRFTIADNVLADIVTFSTRGIPGLHRVSRVAVETGPAGVRLEVEIIANLGCDLRAVAARVQRAARAQVEEMTSLHVAVVNVTVRGIWREQSS